MADETPTTESNGVTAPPAPSPPLRRASSRKWMMLGAGLLLIAGGSGAWWYFRTPRPLSPPVLNVQDGSDTAVVQAIEQARQKVIAEPRSADAWGDLGMLFAAHGYEADANVCFTEAERQGPTDPRWPYFRGLFTQFTQPDEAIGHIRQALTLKCGNPEAVSAMRLRLAELLMEQQQSDQAEALFREELRRSPDHPRARFNLGQLALARGDNAGAQTEFLAVAEGQFTRKRAAIALATLAQAKGELAEAARYAAAAERAPDDPSWPDPFLLQLRGREVGLQGLQREVSKLEAAGQYAPAVAMLLEMVESNPTPRLLVAVGIDLAKMRDYPRAEEFFRACLRKEPGHAQAEYFLAVVLFERAGLLGLDKQEEARGLLREAAAHARAAIKTKPDHGLAWLYLGRSLLALKEPTEAVAALRESVVFRPEIMDTHLFLAEALAAVGQAREALGYAQNAEKLAQPGDSRPRQLLERLQQALPTIRKQ